MITGIDHVQLAAPPGSEERMRAYYQDVLGMTAIRKPPVLAARGGCWFQSGAAQLHIGIEADFRPAAKAHPHQALPGPTSHRSLDQGSPHVDPLTPRARPPSRPAPHASARGCFLAKLFSRNQRERNPWLK